MRTSRVTRYATTGGAAEPFAGNVPLEAKAEQRILRWEWNGQKMRLDLRAQLGRQWSNMLHDAGLSTYRTQYLNQYPIALPPQDENTDYIYAHRQAWQHYAALAGRSVDGGDLHLHLSTPGARASDGITLAVPADGGRLDTLGDEFERWFAGLLRTTGAGRSMEAAVPRIPVRVFGATKGTRAGARGRGIRRRTPGLVFVRFCAG